MKEEVVMIVIPMRTKRRPKIVERVISTSSTIRETTAVMTNVKALTKGEANDNSFPERLRRKK